ncbi:MAG: HypC/HybG/HupF family hydrogenase formation chaperone [Smithellaceae bacterium]|nr:HypC/HybG/HupF family hydrogenase formation chaperone [Smithellaceae bacterium]
MCVAVPARVISIDGQLAEVEIGGVVRQVNVQFTPEARLDDYLLIHAGFSLHVIDEKEAQETLALLAELPDGEVA